MASENKSKVSILTNGIIKENPVLRLVLGTCSCLAVTTAVSSALGMGAALAAIGQSLGGITLDLPRDPRPVTPAEFE